MPRPFHALLLLMIAPAVVRAEDWPQYRGPTRDNAVAGFTVPKVWPKTLKQQWKTPVGEGVASPALVGERIYAFGRIGTDEVMTCLDAGSGKEIWKDKYAGGTVGGGARDFKGPRGSVAVADGKALAFGVGGLGSAGRCGLTHAVPVTRQIVPAGPPKRVGTIHFAMYGPCSLPHGRGSAGRCGLTAARGWRSLRRRSSSVG